MVAYFKKQTILFILLGGVLGIAAGFALIGQQGPGFMRILLPLLSGAVGMVLGRTASAFWANKQVRRYNDLLFIQVEPEKFLEAFTPIVERTPRNTIEYMDGCNKLAYAWEALGDFEKAQSYLASLEPEKGKHADLNCTVTTVSNLLRVLLLQKNTEQAEIQLRKLRTVSEVAMEKSIPLGKSARNCVRLYENWLLVLNGEPADEEYLEKEMDRALNRIRKSELQLLLAQAYVNRGETDLADELRMDALSDGIGLWAEKIARALLQKND